MNKTFTLIEILIVIAIIGVIATLITLSALNVIEKAKVSEAIADFRAYEGSITAFYTDTGDWPVGWARDGHFYCAEDNGLITNMRNWNRWNGPYLETIKTVHPWGGIYCLEYLQVDSIDTPRELILEYNRCCFPSHVRQNQGCKSDKCFVPRKSAEMIDKAIDDSDLTTGDFRYQWFNPEGRADVLWVLKWDAID